MTDATQKSALQRRVEERELRLLSLQDEINGRKWQVTSQQAKSPRELDGELRVAIHQQETIEMRPILQEFRGRLRDANLASQP